MRRRLGYGVGWALAIGAVLIGSGLLANSATTYLVGVTVAALAAAGLLWLIATIRGAPPLSTHGLAVIALLAVGLPAGLIPWSSYHSMVSSQSKWAERYDGSDQYVVDDRFYSLSLLDLYVFDARTGESLAQIAFVSSGGRQLAFGPKHTFYVRDETAVTAYDAEGKELWQRKGDAIAATEKMTVVESCAGTEEKPRCTLRGVDTTTGAQRWTQRMRSDDDAWFGQPEIETTLPNRHPLELPQVIVTDDGRLVDPDTGDTAQRLPGFFGPAISGNRVALPVQAGGSCVMHGYQLDGQTWTSEPIPGRCPFSLSVLDSRMYFSLDDEGAEHPTATLDLTDGSWRRCYGVRLSGNGNDRQTGEGGDEVIVFRDGPGKLLAVDADSGDELWRRNVPSDRPPGLTIGPGTVGVLMGADEDPINPFVPKGKDYRVLVLDARTGERTGEWLGGWPWDTLPVADGLALVLGGDTVWSVGRGA